MSRSTRLSIRSWAIVGSGSLLAGFLIMLSIPTNASLDPLVEMNTFIMITVYGYIVSSIVAESFHYVEVVIGHGILTGGRWTEKERGIMISFFWLLFTAILWTVTSELTRVFVISLGRFMIPLLLILLLFYPLAMSFLVYGNLTKLSRDTWGFIVCLGMVALGSVIPLIAQII